MTSGLAANGTKVPTELGGYQFMKNNDLLQSYPLEVWGATGGFLLEKSALLCGGFLNSKPIKECHYMPGKFKKKLSMQQARGFAASVAFKNVKELISFIGFQKFDNHHTNTHPSNFSRYQ